MQEQSGDRRSTNSPATASAPVSPNAASSGPAISEPATMPPIETGNTRPYARASTSSSSSRGRAVSDENLADDHAAAAEHGERQRRRQRGREAERRERHPDEQQRDRQRPPPPCRAASIRAVTIAPITPPTPNAAEQQAVAAVAGSDLAADQHERDGQHPVHRAAQHVGGRPA